jgi:small-conductance mechanosensitive channel
MNELMATFVDALSDQQTYIQLAVVFFSFVLAQLIASYLGNLFTVLKKKPESGSAPRSAVIAYRLGRLIFPLLGLLLLKLSSELIPAFADSNWLITAAITLALVIFYVQFVREFVTGHLMTRAMLLIGVPLLIMQSVGILPYINSVFESIAMQVGNIKISLAGIMRVLIFGSFIFWLGRVSNSAGQEIIRNQERVDFRTREVAAKLFEIGIFVVVFLLLLQIMGINLTALAVFGGAVGVGLGFGLQTIASNFISGLIILLDRSLSVGDFIELEDGRSGFVRALNMRSTMLETFDGKDIMVPNEMFIASSFVNWTHKNHKQRYRVDFSVAYDSDIRKLVDIIKEAVAAHPQVLSGEQYPIEERPDCEIDSFGDSGVNMFVEFWIEAIDDGKNRVGGDLLLIIFETMRDNGFTIPFPQREVRVLDADPTPKVQRTG